MSGLQGYSSPTPKHVFFSLTPEFEEWFEVVRKVVLRGDVQRFWGCYKGVNEVSYCAPEPVFWTIMRTWPAMFADQESVLILGTPAARNWRSAELLMLKTGERVDIGTWRSATRDEAVKQDAYTYCPDRNLYWICEVDPPANEWERKENTKRAAIEYTIKFLDRLNLHHEDHMRMLLCKRMLNDALEN